MTKHRATRRKPEQVVILGFTMQGAARSIGRGVSAIENARKNPKVKLTASDIPDLGLTIPVSEMVRVIRDFPERLDVPANYGQIALVMLPVKAGKGSGAA